jgi:Ni,Fe-hydrogenase I large subunit
MTKKEIIIDPVTRIEAPLKIEVEVTDGKITDAKKLHFSSPVYIP